MSRADLETIASQWPAAMPAHLRERLAGWLTEWDAGPLGRRMRIELSGRMRSSLGRAYLEQRVVRLNALLVQPGRETLLEEVFCHEVAHLVIHERHGRAVRPHGREWRALLRQVGVPVRVTVPGEECSFLPPRRRRRRMSRRRAPGQSPVLEGLWRAWRRFHGRLI